MPVALGYAHNGRMTEGFRYAMRNSRLWMSRRRRGSLPLLAVLALAACTDAGPGWLRQSALDGIVATGEPIGARPSPSGSYLAGRFALDQGDVATAAARLGEALAADPDNLELRRQVFVLKLASGRFDEAIPAARELVELDPSADEAVLLLALDRVRAGRLAEARAMLGRLGNRGITGVVTPTVRAWVRFAEGDRTAAMESLASGRREDGFEMLRTYHRASMLAVAGRPAEARQLLRPLVDDREPAPLRVVLALAATAAASGQRDEARQVLERQAALTNGNTVLSEALATLAAGGTPPMPIQDARTGIGDALLGLAAALYEQRIAGQALVYARLAGFMMPEAGDAWLLLGRIALAQRNPEQAVDSFGRVPADSPFAWEARLAKVDAQEDLERIDAAVAELRTMAEDRPQRIDALVALGDLLRQKERYAEAEAAYTRAIGRLPRIERGHWRLFYARGIAFERTKRWPEAEADFLKALELEPDQPFVLNYLGYSWVDQGKNLDRAKEMLNQAVKLRPEDGFIVDSLGWAYYRLGEAERAVVHLERAVELEPGDPVINDHLGDAYWRAGRLREARFQWQRALTLKPEQDIVAQIEAKLAHGLPDARSQRG